MRSLFHLILVGLMLAALAFLAAPAFAFRALKADARDGDVQGLAELIDYPALRASLRGQLAPLPAAAQAPAPDVWTDPLGALRHSLEPLTAPPAPPPEPYLSPDALYALSEGYAPGLAPLRPASPPGFAAGLETALAEPWPRLRYWGVNRVRFAVSPKDAPGRETLFTFQRRGLFTWKLVHIGLPRQDSRPPNPPGRP